MARHFLNVAITDKRGADTLEFKTAAMRFVTSSSEVSDTWVRLSLIYHAIECALKAYLASKNVRRKNTHDILDLVQEAESHGLVGTTETISACKHLFQFQRTVSRRVALLLRCATTFQEALRRNRLMF
jgi:hypothetical protein